MGSTQSKISSEPILKSLVIYNADSETPTIVIPHLEPKNRHQASQTTGVPFQTTSVQTDNETNRDSITQTEILKLIEVSIQASVDTSTMSVQTDVQAQDSATQTSERSKIDSSKNSEKLTFTIQRIRFRKEEGTPHHAPVKEPTPENEAEGRAITEVPGVTSNLKESTEEDSEVLKHIKNIRALVHTALEVLNSNGDSDLQLSSFIEQFLSSPKVHQIKQDSIAENKPVDTIESKQELQQELETHKSNKNEASPSNPKDLPRETIAIQTCMHSTTEEVDRKIVSTGSIVQPILSKALKTAPGNSKESSKELSPSAEPQEGTSTAQLVPEESTKPIKEKKLTVWKRIKRALARPLRRVQNLASNNKITCLKGTSSSTRYLLPSTDHKEGSSNGQPIASTACLKTPSEAASGDPQKRSSSKKQVSKNDEESIKDGKIPKRS